MYVCMERCCMPVFASWCLGNWPGGRLQMKRQFCTSLALMHFINGDGDDAAPNSRKTINNIFNGNSFNSFRCTKLLKLINRILPSETILSPIIHLAILAGWKRILACGFIVSAKVVIDNISDHFSFNILITILRCIYTIEH